MIEIAIDPILRLGSLELRWITLFFTGTVVVVITVGIVSGLKRVGVPMIPRNVIGMSLSFIIGSIVGGRLMYTVDNWSYYLEHPEDIISLDGMVIYGSLFGAVAAVAIYIVIKRLPLWRCGDGIAPGAMLGMAVYRIGCVINGCCYGLPTDLPWAVVYTHPDSHAPFGKLVHPTQIYHLALSLMAFAVLWLLRRRLKPDGSLYLLLLILFAITDLPVRFFRVEEPFWLGMKLAVIFDALILLVTIPWFIIRIRSVNSVGTGVPWQS